MFPSVVAKLNFFKVYLFFKNLSLTLYYIVIVFWLDGHIIEDMVHVYIVQETHTPV